MYSKSKTTNRKVKKICGCILLACLLCYLLLCFSLRLSERESVLGEGDCRLYYLVNVDGMKGMGHSILLLVNEQGQGTVLSFNGMQRSLDEALLFQAGVGKLSIGEMNKTETDAFLLTGDLDLEGDQLHDNYDMALFCNITLEDYQAIMTLTEPYVTAGDNYEALYAIVVNSTDASERAEYEKSLEEMGQDASLPLYRLYTHNCDHAARYFAAAADENMAAYNESSFRLTPNGNFKAFARKATDWGVMRLGKTSFIERVLEFLMIF